MIWFFGWLLAVGMYLLHVPLLVIQGVLFLVALCPAMLNRRSAHLGWVIGSLTAFPLAVFVAAAAFQGLVAFVHAGGGDQQLNALLLPFGLFLIQVWLLMVLKRNRAGPEEGTLRRDAGSRTPHSRPWSETAAFPQGCWDFGTSCWKSLRFQKGCVPSGHR